MNDDDFDYDALLRLAEEGYVDLDPGIDQPQVFDDQFERRARELNRKPYAQAKSQVSSLIPQRQGPWSGNNQLGSELAFEPDVNNLQTILKMDEWDMPQLWTGLLGLAYQEDTGAVFGIRALVAVGSGGATQEFAMDWIEGSRFCVAGNAINVRAQYIFPDPILANIPSDIMLRVTLGTGGGVACAPATLTEYSIDLASGATFEVQLPKFASSVFVMSDEDPAVTYNAANELHFRILSGAGGNIARIDGDQIPGFPEGVIVPNGTRYVAFVNNSGTTITRLLLVFRLRF